jgi:hypothetical protein
MIDSFIVPSAAMPPPPSNFRPFHFTEAERLDIIAVLTLTVIAIRLPASHATTFTGPSLTPKRRSWSATLAISRSDINFVAMNHYARELYELFQGPDYAHY